MDGPRLYILMRTDMDSMNPGKGMAQAAHAANQFVAQMHEACAAVSENRSTNLLPGGNREEMCRGFEDWIRQGKDFGTTIVLDGGTEQQMYTAVEEAAYVGYPSGIVHDSTYPVRDGKVTHLLPIDTCAYFFIPSGENASTKLAALSLHP